LKLYAAIAGPSQGHIVNLTDRRAALSRQAQLDLLDRLSRRRQASAPAPCARLPWWRRSSTGRAPYHFTARFSVAHGGKDGHPFPVPLGVCDETIRVIKPAVRKAKLGSDEELAALRRLDAQARLLELGLQACRAGADRSRSPAWGGRSV
jgi:hypothetical protein